MRIFPRLICLFLCLALLSGCQSYLLRGALYTHIRIPLTRNLENTPGPQVMSRSRGKMVRITEPFTGYGMYTEVYTNAIGEIARRHGIETIYFADREIFQVLGVWSSSTIHIYGE